jgi:hypothetical protein
MGRGGRAIVVLFRYPPPLPSACIDRLYLSHRGKKDKERGKEGAVITYRKKEVVVSNKSAKKSGLIQIYYHYGGGFYPLT